MIREQVPKTLEMTSVMEEVVESIGEELDQLATEGRWESLRDLHHILDRDFLFQQLAGEQLNEVIVGGRDLVLEDGEVKKKAFFVNERRLEDGGYREKILGILSQIVYAENSEQESLHGFRFRVRDKISVMLEELDR